jgi:hypothetical protein
VIIGILIVWSPDDDPLGSKHLGQFLYNKNHCAFVGVSLNTIFHNVHHSDLPNICTVTSKKFAEEEKPELEGRVSKLFNN